MHDFRLPPLRTASVPWHTTVARGLPQWLANHDCELERACRNALSHRTVRSYLPDRLFRTLPSRLRSPHLRGSFWSIPTAIARVIRRLHVGCRVRKEDSELSADNF